VQNAVNGVVKEQKQPVAQGWVELQLPPQAKPFGSLRNWRAETVPAQTTAMTMVANNVDLTIFLPMIAILFKLEGRLMALSIHSGLAIAKVLFQVG